MVKIKMNDSIARAVAWDVGNYSMKKHGGDRWSVEDYNAAVEKYNELMGY